MQRALAGHYAAVARERISDEPPPPLGDIRRRGKVRVFTALPVFSDGTRDRGGARVAHRPRRAVVAVGEPARPGRGLVALLSLLSFGVSLRVLRGDRARRCGG